MRRLYSVLTILIVVFFFSIVFGQNKQIGPIGGLNLASVSVDGTEEDINTSFRTGFAVGGSFYLAFTPNIGMQFEPTFMQKGSKVELEFVEGNDNIKMEQTLKANYIDLPILFKASFGQGSVKPYVLAGGNIAFRMGDTKVKVDKFTLNGQDITSLVPSDSLEDELKTKSMDFGINFGAGILFPMGTSNLFIEGQYNMGLININDEDDSDEVDVKTKGIVIKAGILFPLGK